MQFLKALYIYQRNFGGLMSDHKVMLTMNMAANIWWWIAKQRVYLLAKCRLGLLMSLWFSCAQLFLFFVSIYVNYNCDFDFGGKSPTLLFVVVCSCDFGKREKHNTILINCIFCVPSSYIVGHVYLMCVCYIFCLHSLHYDKIMNIYL